MALSRISFSDSLLSTFTRISRSACMEVQCAKSATVHRKWQAIHVTSMRCYPDPPTIALPNNVCDIFASETSRFTSERARDIALYAENGGIAADYSGFPKIRDNGHMDSYDCFGAVSLNGTMQSNVPKPFSSHGKSTHLNMPGGQWSRDGKYIAEDMQRSHYRKLSSYTATNAFITSPLLRTIHQQIHTIKMGYSTDNKLVPKDTNKNQTAMLTMMSKREKFRLMLRDYGGTLLAFHITISLISLGGCYMVVISGVDVMPLVQTLTGGNEQLDNLMKTSTDFILAYTVHKLLAPVRISISLAVTPTLVRHLRKIGLLKMPKAKTTTPPSL